MEQIGSADDLAAPGAPRDVTVEAAQHGTARIAGDQLTGERLTLDSTEDHASGVAYDLADGLILNMDNIGIHQAASRP
jgi:hypothetical protein